MYSTGKTKYITKSPPNLEKLPYYIRKRIIVDKNKCWLWIGTKNKAGYGIVCSNKKSHLAHRHLYEITVGELHKLKPHLHHICKVHACVNPEHLLPVDHCEHLYIEKNNIGHKFKIRKFCDNGHPYTEDNIINSKENRRRCKICNRERNKKEYYSRKIVPRQEYADYILDGHTLKQATEYFKVSMATITKYLPKDYRRNLHQEKVNKAIKLIENSYSVKEISEIMRLNRQTIYNWLNEVREGPSS